MALKISARCLPLAPATLPHTTPTAAWQSILSQTPELVFWPVLARRGAAEQPWAWAGHGFPGLAQEQPLVSTAAFQEGLDQLYLRYLLHDLAAAAQPVVERGVASPAWPDGALSRVAVLGARLLGPLSLALSLLDENERPLLASAEQRDAVAKHLRLRSAWLEATLGQLGPATLICLDEPFLDAIQSPFLALSWDEARALIEEAFGSLQGARALAPGCHGDWALLLELQLDLLICLDEEAERLLAVGSQLLRYLEAGGVIAWALVPSDEAELERTSAASIAEHLEHLLARAEVHHLPAELILNRSLLTVAGRLDHLSTARAERTLALLAEASGLIRTRHGLVEEQTNLSPSRL